MIELYSSALQGFTEFPWRTYHSKIFGGITKYYAPFMRIEHGTFRNKDIKDILPENNDSITLIPQILATNKDDARRMTDKIIEMGYREIDINFGCPFPPVCKRHHAAGMLQSPELVAELLSALKEYKISGVEFSIKTRLGYADSGEMVNILPIFNDFSPLHITFHLRVAKQQYSGDLDYDSFDYVYANSAVPVVFNGDVRTISDIDTVVSRYPEIKAIALGRGLLCNPAIARQYTGGKELSVGEYMLFHSNLLCHYAGTLSGDAHILAKIKPFWEYAPVDIDGKVLKLIKKSSTLAKYKDAVSRMG